MPSRKDRAPPGASEKSPSNSMFSAFVISAWLLSAVFVVLFAVLVQEARRDIESSRSMFDTHGKKDEGSSERRVVVVNGGNMRGNASVAVGGSLGYPSGLVTHGLALMNSDGERWITPMSVVPPRYATGAALPHGILSLSQGSFLVGPLGVSIGSLTPSEVSNARDDGPASWAQTLSRASSPSFGSQYTEVTRGLTLSVSKDAPVFGFDMKGTVKLDPDPSNFPSVDSYRPTIGARLELGFSGDESRDEESSERAFVRMSATESPARPSSPEERFKTEWFHRGMRVYKEGGGGQCATDERFKSGRSNVCIEGHVHSSTGTYGIISDARAKHVGFQVEKEGAALRLQKARVYDYTFRDDTQRRVRRGAIAQQMGALDDAYILPMHDKANDSTRSHDSENGPPLALSADTILSDIILSIQWAHELERSMHHMLNTGQFSLPSSFPSSSPPSGAEHGSLGYVVNKHTVAKGE